MNDSDNSLSSSRCDAVKKCLLSRLFLSVLLTLSCSVVLLSLAVNVGIIAAILQPFHSPELNLKIETSFFTIEHGSTGGTPASESYFFRIPDKILGVEFIFTELIKKGNAHDDVSHTAPSESGIPLYWQLSDDGTLLLLYRKQLAVRASNARDATLLEDGVSDFLIAQTAVYSRSGSETVVLGQDLLNTHFGVPFEMTDFTEPSSFEIRVVNIKGYPRNINFVLEVRSLVSQVQATVWTFVSFALLPDTPMVSRVADHRIGYFATQYTNIGVHPTTTRTPYDETKLPASIGAYEVDRQINVINKWRLEKSDDCDDLTNKMGCKPLKPILYYVDPTVPSVWQKYVKIGIELWQPAFAALGFKDTPRAILPEDDDFPADYDSGDIRYASVSFAISRDSVFSVGPSVTDPRTGEILDADIGFSQEWVHAFSGEISKESLSGLSLYDAMSSKHDHRRLRSRHGCDHERLASFMDDIGMSMRMLADVSDNNGRVPTEIIGRGLAGVTVHEVGHTLGL